MERRRRLAVILGIVALLLALLGGGLLVWQLFVAPPQKGHEAPVTKIIPLTSSDVDRLEKALNSPDLHTQATAMVPEVATSYVQTGKPLMPSGATIKFLLNTNDCKGIVCEVDATITEAGGKQTTYIVYLDHSTGTWLVAATSPK